MKGVPIRVEIGPKDIEKQQIVAVRRDTGEKVDIKRSNAVGQLKSLLKQIQTNLYQKYVLYLTKNYYMCNVNRRF